MPRSPQLMFHELAPQYDALYGAKDYRAEARFLEGLARRWGRTPRGSWLDVACGTGRHLSYLRAHHEAVGVDASPEMLRIARRRLPGVRLVRGDMRSFDLHRRFDVVSCLFSAIGHLTSERDLAAAFANFARHLEPGGVVLIEPWIDPEEFRPGHVHVVAHQDGHEGVARLAVSARRGDRSIVRYHYLVARPGGRIRHLAETDVGLLVGRQRLVELLSAAGLQARFLRRGLGSGRGLLVGRKPGGAGSPRRQAGSTSRVYSAAPSDGPSGSHPTLGGRLRVRAP